MIVKELASGIILGLIVIIATIWFTRHSEDAQDSVLEEAVEEMLEDKIEDVLGLDSEALSGVIDLTPGTPEKSEN